MACSLYLRVLSYSSALDTVSKHNFYLKKKRSKASQKEIEKSTEKPQINEQKEYDIYKMGF